MFKASARSRFAGHVFSSRSRPITTDVLPHLRPVSQTRCSSQKRSYSGAAYTDSRFSTAKTAEVPAFDGNARLADHLNRVFSPLQFPPEVAARILTHASFRDWRVSHNGRLAFIGRRVLNSYLLLFLHSSSALNVSHNVEQIAERALETHVLGEFVGSRWGLGRTMRWSPVQSTGRSDLAGEVPNSVGLYKIQGTTAEAVMGGIYHEFGGAVAHRVFHTRVLPHLLLPGSSLGLNDAFHADAKKICEEMGGLEGNLLIPASRSTSSKIS